MTGAGCGLDGGGVVGREGCAGWLWWLACVCLCGGLAACVCLGVHGVSVVADVLSWVEISRETASPARGTQSYLPR